MSRRIKILIAEQNVVFRECLAALFQTDREFETVGQVATGDELLEELKNKPADIVLLNNEMPVLKEQMALERLHTFYPSVKIIVFSNQANATVKQENAHNHPIYLNRQCKVGTMFEIIKAAGLGSKMDRRRG